jgi:hypothetical protein
MKITTSVPVVVNRNPTPSELYSMAGGDVIQLVAAGSMPNVVDSLDRDNFYPAEGDKYAKFDELPSFKEPHSNALGFRSKSERKNMRADRQNRRNLRTQSKADARLTKAGAKQTQADAQKEGAIALGKEDKGAIALAGTLSKKGAKKGMSTGAKIAIGVGAAAVLGVVGYLIYKKVKGK